MLINRPELLKKVSSYKDTKLIKILSGVRGCGKSTLLQMYQNLLTEQGTIPNQIQSFNLLNITDNSLLDMQNLQDHILKNLVSDKMNYIFLQEIQVIKNFGRLVNSLFLQENIDIYLSVSNSKIQAFEISNIIEKNYIFIPIYPLSFKEYLSGCKGKSKDECFEDYIRYSSFPGIFSLSKISESDNYLRKLYETGIQADIIENRKIKDLDKFSAVLRDMAESIGEYTSVNKIAKVLISSEKRLDNITLMNYIDDLCDSYVFYKIYRWDIYRKNLLKIQNKYYSVDVGLRNLFLDNTVTDTEKMIENIVFLELKRRGYKVYAGKIRTNVIDFVAQNQNGTEYFQVSEEIREGKSCIKKFEALKTIRDNHPKYILTKDSESCLYCGVKIRNVVDWLSGEAEN